MKVRTWNPSMSAQETADLAYWERNVLALHFAQGWYFDDVQQTTVEGHRYLAPRFPGWHRVLSLEGGKTTFHVPDDFDVGDLPKIAPNWDGHTTDAKWVRILLMHGVEVEP